MNRTNSFDDDDDDDDDDGDDDDDDGSWVFSCAAWAAQKVGAIVNLEPKIEA